MSQIGSRRWITAVGALLGLLAVAFGAFGAHALKASLDAYSSGVYETAARYQMLHAVVIVILGLGSLCDLLSQRWLNLAAIAFTLGVIIFSGSLYILAITGITWLGAITPVGGLLLIIGWASLFIAAIKGPPSKIPKS